MTIQVKAEENRLLRFNCLGRGCLLTSYLLVCASWYLMVILYCLCVSACDFICCSGMLPYFGAFDSTVNINSILIPVNQYQTTTD